MSDNIQELRTVFSGDSRSYDEATDRVINGMNRQERAAQSTAKALDLYNRALHGVADAKKKAGGGGHGGGGHGGGGMMENLGWAVHDASEGRMANALGRLTSAFSLTGAAAAAAFMSIKAYSSAMETQSKLVDSTASLRKASGQGRLSAVDRNEFLRPFEGFLSPLLTVGDGGDANKESLEAKAKQREEILAGIDKVREDRENIGYWGRFTDTYFSPFMLHGGRVAEGLEQERNSEDNLMSLDQESAEIVKRRTGIGRQRAFGSERAGRLSESEFQADEDRAKIHDARNAGKIGVAEADAQLKEIESQREIRDRQTNLQFDAQKRARDLTGQDIYTRGRGDHVAQGLAANRMYEAEAEEKAAPTDEARAAARTKYVSAWFDENQASKAQRERDASLDAAKKIADLRGSTESRALAAAEAELQKEKDLLSIAKERGADAEKAANVAVAGAQRTLDLLKEQQAVQRVNYENQVGKMPRDLAAAGARLHGASPEAAERAQLASALADAGDDVAAARKNKRLQHYSVESRAAFAAAEHTRGQAQVALDLYDKDFTRDRGRQLDQAHGETAALRYAAVGRDDLAGLTRERAQSRLGIEDANFHQNPGLAAELGEQQQLRERRMLTEKFLNPDGTRRNPAAVQAEEVANRRRAMRINAFFGTTPAANVQGGLESGNGIETAASRHLYALNFAHDPAARLANARGPQFGGTDLSHGATKVGEMGLGLVGVSHGMDGSILSARDALTGETLNAGQIHEREAQAKKTADYHAANAKDDRSDREVQQDIFKVLNDRLPATTTK